MFSSFFLASAPSFSGAAFHHHSSKGSIEKWRDFHKNSVHHSLPVWGFGRVLVSISNRCVMVCKVNFHHHNLQKSTAMHRNVRFNSYALVWLEFIKWPVSSWREPKEVYCFLRPQRADYVCAWLLNLLVYFQPTIFLLTITIFNVSISAFFFFFDRRFLHTSHRRTMPTVARRLK